MDINRLEELKFQAADLYRYLVRNRKRYVRHGEDECRYYCVCERVLERYRRRFRKWYKAVRERMV